ncbi:MAG: glycosyltransferase, partial [Gammaproteobacteria bacterium]|nr:glycosyltransferase [Gammaproteobacteria bacterium]
MTRQIVNTNEFGHDCAIIITVHNHVERFGIPCLNSILKYSGGARVFLYDNESADPKIVVLKQLAIKHSEIDYIRIDDQSTFGGLTGTWNDGIRRAREAGLKKVILLNHDVVVDETWENFIKAIDSDTALYGPLSNLPGGGDGN